MQPASPCPSHLSRGNRSLQQALALFRVLIVPLVAAMPSSYREGDAQHPISSQSSPTSLPGGMEERQARRSLTADSMMAEAVTQSSKAVGRR